MEDCKRYFEGEKNIMNEFIISRWKTKIFVVIVIAIIFSAILGYHKYSQRELMKQELNLDGLFVNIKGVEVKTIDGGFFSEKPYEKIVIKIPSIASVGDDARKEGQDKINQIIDREKLGKGFENWLRHIFNITIAKNYTDKIEIWYRDNKVIDEPAKDGRWDSK